MFGRNLSNVRDLLMGVIPELPSARDCECAHALDHARVEVE